MEFTIENGLEPSLVDSVARLRGLAWAEQLPNAGGGPFKYGWIDEHDAISLHFLAWQNGSLVGAARASFHESVSAVPDAFVYEETSVEWMGPIGSLNRLVVAPNCRGQGIAERLDTDRLRLLAAESVTCVVCWCAFISGPARLSALKSRGFIAVGPPRAGPGLIGDVVPLSLKVARVAG